MIVIKKKKTKFLKASTYVQSYHTLAEITALWNATAFGRPAQEVTVKRWLNNGPISKNPKFEPWILSVAKKHKVDVLNSFIPDNTKPTLKIKPIRTNDMIETLRRTPDTSFNTTSDAVHAGAMVLIHDRLSYLSIRELAYVKYLINSLTTQ